MDSTASVNNPNILDNAEIRVLAVLIEKSFTTPDVYPLSVNALQTGCNQLTARSPVMSLSEQEVQAAIDQLMTKRLVSKRDQPSARVAKYEHLIRLRYSVIPAEQAVLALLMLRGPQTAGEIRQRTERMHTFASIAEVEALLEHLGEKNPPLVCTLPRTPGTKEIRYMHLLGGEAEIEVAIEAYSSATGTNIRSKTASLEEEINTLRAEFEALRQEFDAFKCQFD